MIINEQKAVALNEAIAKALKEIELSEIKANEDGSNTFKVVATDATVDRDGEVLTLDGWEVENYLKNPVMFIDHNSWSVNYIASKVTKLYFENNQMIIEGVFTDKTEAGRIAQALYNEGFLKSVSVGFLIKQRNDDNNKIIEKKELYEVSWVGVPCNPNATSLDGKMYKKGLEMGIIKEEEQEIKYATQDDISRVESKIDKLLDMLDGKSDKEKNIDFDSKEFIQSINRMTADKLREMKGL